eukprot:Phypoly_transcript_01796.p1 GENE.Phypoly_transcript_01796~~Phypoly_transcript_01796.p1  ORF type:complete len:954 (+),score=144.73 Phypoly_transcript_01796:249-3110(+)
MDSDHHLHLSFLWTMHEKGQKKTKKTISLLSINAEVQFLKCLAWSPSNYDPNLIAAGLANGKTVLTSFSSVNRITKEFVPRHSRSCNAVVWNPFYKNQLACGLDKVRGDFSTIVWDVSHGSLPTASPDHFAGRFDNPHSISQRDDNQFNLLPQEAASTVVEPIHELANSETTLALAWVPNSPSCLAAGTGAKWLRIYDLRGDINAPRSVMAHTKAVSGVCFDFFDYNRLATFSEDGIVKVWDLRKLVDPTLTINTNAKAIQQIDWCPTRSGVLATIFKDGNTMKIWDVKEYAADSTRNGALITKPSKTYHSPEIISSFAWHPSNECRMLIISPNTMAETVSLNETIPLTFSPHSDMCFSYGTHFVTGPIATPAPGTPVATPNDKNEYVDISVLMKQRALQGYSASIEENKTLSMLFNDKGLQFLWTWASNSIVKKKDAPAEFTGIYSVLHDGYVPPVPSTGLINWGDSDRHTPGLDKSGFFPVYKSAQRMLCLEICGWGFTNSHALENALLKLEREGEYERAAAMAVFHLDVRRAVTALNRGSSSSTLHDKDREFNLRLVAVALAGFSENQAASNHSYYNNSLWRETCASMSSQYKHPYLSACFGFLCNEIQSVLDMSALALRDRIAVACRYLNNEMLINYIERAQQQSIDVGDLAGVIITGLTPKGVELFQRYVDRTGDVQSASLAMGLVVPSLFKDPRVARWNSAYRELLDNWQLWHERALLDIRRGSPDSAPRPQVYARCNFCNQSLSLGVLAVNSTRFAVRGNAPGVKHIVNSCPSCKKPLPRCSLCLLNLNCSLPTYDRRSSIPPPPTAATLHSSSSSSSLHHSSSSSSTLHHSSPSPFHPSHPPPSPYATNKNQPPTPNLGGAKQPPGTPATQGASAGAGTHAGNAGAGAQGGDELGQWTSGSNAFDEWFSWCQTCRHGGHAKHLLEWFSVHAECPVTDCTCKCCSI